MSSPQGIPMEESVFGILIGVLGTLGLGVLTFLGVVKRSSSDETVAQITSAATYQQIHNNAVATFRKDLMEEIKRIETALRSAETALNDATAARTSADQARKEADKLRQYAEKERDRATLQLNVAMRANRKMIGLLRQWVPRETLEEISGLPEGM